MVKRYFEWIAGDAAEDIEMLESIEDVEGEIIYHFISGESCNQRFISKMTNSVSDLKDKFMVEIESPSNAWTFEEIVAKKYIDKSMDGEDVEIPTLHDMLQARGTSNVGISNSDLGTKKLVAPRREQYIVDLPSINDWRIKTTEKMVSKKNDDIVETNKVEFIERDNSAVETHIVQPTIEIQEKEVIAAPIQTISENDPVKILVDTCKKYDTEIDLTLNLSAPSKDMFNIASNNFENGASRFIDRIIEDIDLKEIIDSLRDALLNAYQEKNDV